MHIQKLPVNPFDDAISFEDKVISVFRYQFRNNRIYKTFCETLGIREHQINGVHDIPLLPVRAFKESRMTTLNYKAGLYFKSSGTSDMKQAVHEVPDPEIYRESVLKGFDYFYPDRPLIFSYLPGYSENPYSSLVWMLSRLIKRDKSGISKFLTENEINNQEFWDQLPNEKRRVVLFGAAFGLVDIVENSRVQLPDHSILIETGGMKTHKREIPRNELHKKLAAGFGINETQVHSEYGMCELLSQAYATENQQFIPVPWMKMSIRNPDNPVEILPSGEEGLIGIIDLANIFSCSFILTGDRGSEVTSGKYHISGRWNPENLRGCNFLIDKD